MSKEQNKTVAICGLGYVGYPVAMLFADAGFDVIGIDIFYIAATAFSLSYFQSRSAARNQ